MVPILTGSVSLDVSHLDQPVCRLLNVVIAVGQDVQQKILLNRREDTFQVPAQRTDYRQLARLQALTVN